MGRSAEFLSPAENINLLPKEVVYLGSEMVVAYCGWGEPVDNQRIIDEFIGDHPQREELIKTVKGAGISVRQHILRPELRERDDALLVEEQINVGAQVTLEALRANQWKRADLLVVASSAPPSLDFAEQIAEKAGLANIKTKLYCLACNGAIAALHDVLRTGELKNSRVVITAVEGLSHGVDLRKGKVDVAALAIFGNGASSFAFLPQKIELLDGRTWIIPDKIGVIKTPLKRGCAFPPRDERLKPPAWYEVDPEAEELFAFTPERVMIKLLVTSDEYLKMDGFNTAKYFARQVPPLVGAFLKDFYRHQSNQPETLLGVFHQPSEGVLLLTRERLLKMLSKAELPAMNIPWVLGRVGMGNVSSATTFLALAQLMREGSLPRGVPFNLTAFGVGAAITSMMIRMNDV